MQCRNDQPNIDNFGFSNDSVFTAIMQLPGTSLNPPNDAFLLLEGSFFMLLDGTNFLLLGT